MLRHIQTQINANDALLTAPLSQSFDILVEKVEALKVRLYQDIKEAEPSRNIELEPTKQYIRGKCTG